MKPGKAVRRLILFRHAKADTPEGVADVERPLNERGRAEAPLMGAFLARERLRPDAAMVSASRRTRETWELAAAALKPQPPAAFDERLYDAPAETLLDVVREASGNVRSLLLIGHNPGVEELARMLAKGRMKFPPAGLAVIEFPGKTWRKLEPGTGRLVLFVTPELLAAQK